MDAVTDELTEMMLHFLDPSSIISCAQLDPVNGCATTYSSTPSHVLLTSLKERESNFASFSPKHSTLSIGPDERILAAYGQRIITSRAKALPVLDQGVSKWAAMVEYKETVDGDLRTWAKKKHLWDFEPLRISVDLERDLVMASEVYRGEDRSMIKFFSLSGDPIPCREKHLRWSGQSRNLEGGPRRTMFGPLNSFIVVAPPSLNIFSLFDGQQLAAITIPGGIKSSHVIQCVWPNYITISSSIIWTWAGNPDKDAGLDQRLFIYDLNNILLSNKDKPGPKIVNKPHYKLIYPRAISDLPPHIHKKLQEIYPDKVPLVPVIVRAPKISPPRTII
ncbi:uncharacterized protein L199_006786 [Kwoniella botswanensis]|uniref:uncharacterized protein n=1 Tax=Kwoniella botswanensis TaxID=1268659 RepID=UPI00315CB0A1